MNRLMDAQSDAEMKVAKFLDVLISEVKKRPILWDKNYRADKLIRNRAKITKEWQRLAALLNRSPDEIKAKWRNLKDFHREEKKIFLPEIDEGKPIAHYYTGQWDKFEKLIFLYNTRWHTRSHEEYIQVHTTPAVSTEHIKEELICLSDQSNDNDRLLEKYRDDHSVMTNNDDRSVRTSIDEASTAFSATSELDGNASRLGNTRDRSKVALDVSDVDNEQPNKRKAVAPMKVDLDVDEKMLVEALVPFLRKLNPVRKLIVRNELQNLLLKEFLCDHCNKNGPRPLCDCNLI